MLLGKGSFPVYIEGYITINSSKKTEIFIFFELFFVVSKYDSDKIICTTEFIFVEANLQVIIKFQ